MLTQEQVREARELAWCYYRTAGIVLTRAEIEGIEVADFGLGDLGRIGLEVVTYVNTERVCAKELVLFPFQTCPEHYHPGRDGVPGKEETFRCRYGRVHLYVPGPAAAKPWLDGLEDYREFLRSAREIILEPGEQYTLLPDTPHWFRGGEEGAVVSEFSTSSTDAADVFTDPSIERFTRVASEGSESCAG